MPIRKLPPREQRTPSVTQTNAVAVAPSSAPLLLLAGNSQCGGMHAQLSIVPEGKYGVLVTLCAGGKRYQLHGSVMLGTSLVDVALLTGVGRELVGVLADVEKKTARLLVRPAHSTVEFHFQLGQRGPAAKEKR